MLARKLRYEHEYEYEYYAGKSAAAHQQATDAIRVSAPAVRVPVCNTVLRRRVAAVVIMILAFAFCMAMRSDVFIQNGYKLNELRKQENELIKNIEYMQVNLAKARAPERIIARAEQLGMVAANGNFYVRAVEAVENDSQKNSAWNHRLLAKLGVER